MGSCHCRAVRDEAEHSPGNVRCIQPALHPTRWHSVSVEDCRPLRRRAVYWPEVTSLMTGLRATRDVPSPPAARLFLNCVALAGANPSTKDRERETRSVHPVGRKSPAAFDRRCSPVTRGVWSSTRPAAGRETSASPDAHARHPCPQSAGPADPSRASGQSARASRRCRRPTRQSAPGS